MAFSDTPDAAPGPVGGAPLRPGPIILLMGLAQLAITSDFSMISIALPSIGRDLQIQPALLAWVVAANATLFAGFLIVGGRLADLLGHRRCLQWGVWLFAAGSLACGLSANIWMLIAARCLQGLGAALISPASFSLIHAFLPEGPLRHRALGVFGTLQGVSVMLGFAVGGYLTTWLGWRSVFFLNLPVLAVALALATTILPRRGSGGPRGIADIGGAVLITLAVGLLLSAVSATQAQGLASATTLTAIVAALTAIAAVIVLEQRHPDPLIPPDLLVIPNLLPGGLALAGLIAAVGGIFVLISLYLQIGLHATAAHSGLGMAPLALATMAAGQAAPLLMRRWPLPRLAAGGLILEVASLLAVAAAATTGHYLAQVAPLAFAAIFGSSLAFMSLMGLALDRAPADRQGVASALLFTVQQIGLPLGVAIALAVLNAGGPAASLAAFRLAFLVPAVLAGLSLTVVLVLSRTAAAPASQ